MAEPYEPAKDHYRRFREGVIEMHTTGKSKKDLSKIIGALPDKKIASYNMMVDGYKKFLGTKNPTWFNPLRKDWAHGNIEIPINPELGLEWGGTKYLIKLYLKADKPSKDRVASVLALMKHTLGANNCVHAVLDVRNNKLHTFEASMLGLIPLVEAEANSLAHLLK